MTIPLPPPIADPAEDRRQPAATGRPAGADRLAGLLSTRRLLVLTGAGCSTGSGIPDYRAPDGSWRHGKPMNFRNFTAGAAARRRYWARSAVGWQRIAAAAPNRAHRALAALEAAGRVQGVVTQNIDGLHQRAGSRRVIDLHGRLDRVHCRGCHARFRRDQFQRQLERLNPGWPQRPEAAASATVKPDGDADLGSVDYDSYRLPNCPFCGSDELKPDVVFFGETIPRRRTAAALALLAGADGLLVVGSSLTVWSGYRFARDTAASGRPLAILNRGVTRADEEAALKIDGECGEVLEEIACRLAEGHRREA